MVELRARVYVDGEAVPALVEYRGSARVRLNELVFEVSFDREKLDIDIRAARLSRDTLQLLLKSLRDMPLRVSLRGGGEEYVASVRIYGVRLLVLKKRE